MDHLWINLHHPETAFWDPFFAAIYYTSCFWCLPEARPDLTEAPEKLLGFRGVSARPGPARQSFPVILQGAENRSVAEEQARKGVVYPECNAKFSCRIHGSSGFLQPCWGQRRNPVPKKVKSVVEGRPKLENRLNGAPQVSEPTEWVLKT